jgi:hypothetical protein
MTASKKDNFIFKLGHFIVVINVFTCYKHSSLTVRIRKQECTTPGKQSDLRNLVSKRLILSYINSLLMHYFNLDHNNLN